MAQVKLRLGEYLDEHDLSAYKLAMQLERGRENTVYRLVRRGEDIKRIDLDVLADILQGLRKLTHKEVVFDDLLEYIPDTTEGISSLRESNKVNHNGD